MFRSMLLKVADLITLVVMCLLIHNSPLEIGEKTTLDFSEFFVETVCKAQSVTCQLLAMSFKESEHRRSRKEP